MKSGFEVVKLFSCSTRLSMNFFLLICMKISSNSAFYLGLDKLRMLYFLFINVKMPTPVGNLTFITGNIYYRNKLCSAELSMKIVL